MTDRYDNSFSRRPNPADGRTEPRTSAEPDPLAELARMVSGKPSFDDLVAGQGRAQPAPRTAQPTVRPAPRDVSFDLESELMNDLQSSFDNNPRDPNARQAPPRATPAAPPRAAVRDAAPQRQTFDHMQVRSGQAAQPAAPSTWASEPYPSQSQDDDPYAGTAYAGSGDYDAPSPTAADASRVFGGAYRAGQESAEPAPEGYDEYYGEDDANSAYDDGYGDQPRYADDDYEPPRPNRARKGLITAAIVLGVILVGGLAAIALKDRMSTTGSGGTPKIIAADDGPTKIQPTVQPTEGDGQQNNKLIYDRANPDTTSEQLVLPDDGPVDEKPPTNESSASREISRIILPGGAGDGSSSAPAVPENGALPPSDAAPVADANAQAATDETDVGPRKVRTVVVKPDGTIISSEALPRGATANANTGADAANPAPAAVALTAPTSDPASTAVSAPAAVPAPGATQRVASADPAVPAPASQKDASQLDEPAPAPRKAVATPKPAVRPGPDDTQQVAVSAPSSGGFVVQVTSQRTLEQARTAFAALQKKYPDVLASRTPDIAKADLGAKGTFYRARIGPMATRDEATSFCEALRSAGGDCIVQKN